MENTCPRWDSNQPLPLKIRSSLNNLPNPPQSDADTHESEAQGVHNVQTHSYERFEPMLRTFRALCSAAIIGRHSPCHSLPQPKSYGRPWLCVSVLQANF